MIAKYGDKVVRKATLSDADALVDFFEEVIVDSSQSDSMQDMQKRTLAKLMKFHLEHKDSLVIEKSGEIVAGYVGTGNDITYIRSTSKDDPEVLGLLMYFVLCGMHNMYKESVFVAELERQREVFSKISIVDFKGNVGKISAESKLKVEKLFNKIKDYYGEST